MHPAVAFGISAGERTGQAELATVVEALGYGELWVNDTRHADGLATLGSMAPATRALRFGVGVMALSEQPPERIAERVQEAALPVERLSVGVGSGSSRSLDLVRAGVAQLRRLLPDHRLGVAAVGPRMAALAGELADDVVANWALPERLAELRGQIAAGASSVGRPVPRLVAYVRTAVGPGAEARVRAEMERYARYAPHYARAFAAQPASLVGVAVEPADPAAVAQALAPYRSVVDTVVVRALPLDDSVDAWLEVARAAAPRRVSRGSR